MKSIFQLLVIMGVTYSSQAQEIVPLSFEKMEGVDYQVAEREYYSDIWQNSVVTNVSEPTMAVFQPSRDKRNGTAVIIAPGGGLFGLSINSEGRDVANWLVAQGVTAFVLKYRLVPSGKDATKEIGELFEKDPEGTMKTVQEVLPFSVQDGLNAISHVRENATKYGVSPGKIGFMGFSAGGAVTMGVSYQYNEANKPNFLVPVYPWTDAMPVAAPKDDAPPMFIICATDDGLGLASGSIDLYQSYYNKGFNVALHMYAKGDHGFGMKTQGLPSDKWIERFYEWAVVEGLISPR